MNTTNDNVTAQLSRIGDEVNGFIAKQKNRHQELSDKQGELMARLHEAEQKLDQRAAGVSHGSSGPSLGSQVEAAFKDNREMFAKTRGITLDVKAAITTGETGGAHGTLAVPNATGQVSTQLVGMLTHGPLDGLTVLHYARRTGVTGGAAAQDDEAAAKAAAEPVFTAITQNTITVAGYATVSEQALNAAGGLARAVDSHLKKSVRDAIDAILVAGTAAAGWPFAGFAALAATFTGPATYLALVDAILAGALRMRLQGFNPSICVLPEAGFLGIQLAKDTTGRHLTDTYLADLSLAIGGMRVALAAGVPAGKAVLIDPAYCGLLAAGSTKVTIGYTGTQFTENMCTVRGETQILPYFTDYQGAMEVTPAAA